MVVLRCLILILFVTTSLCAAGEIRVLKPDICPHPDLMMEQWLNQQAKTAFAKWQQRYDALQTPDQILEYQHLLREKFVSNLGGFPERTPLNPQITGTVTRTGYRVEKILFESQPQHYVTGLCFIPDAAKFKAPYPAVLIVCGHSEEGKGFAGYQTAGALTALNGMIGFVIDPVCQGEREQSIHPELKIPNHNSTYDHSVVGLGSILLGHNTARFEIWDGMRAIDYLQTRTDVIPEKIGCMGNSGGGTQTSYLMSLDDRIKVASPSCYITTMESLLNTIGPQDAEQNIFGQLNWGMDHADYLMLRAPVPIMMCTGTQDFFPIEGAWKSFRHAKRIYTRLGYSDHINLTEMDAKHGWHQPLREASVSWMKRWLLGSDNVVHEPEIKLLSPAEFQVTPDGQVQLIAGAKSVYDLNMADFERLKTKRKSLWSQPEVAIQKVREIAGIRPLQTLPQPTVIKVDQSQTENITIEKWVLKIDDGIVLPVLIYRPSQPSKSYVVYVHDEGKQGLIAEPLHSTFSLAQAGHTVLAVDLRGTGETTPQKATWYHADFGPDGKHLATAYLLGQNYVGLRAEDILITARWFLEHENLPLEQHKLELISVGHVGIPALHAMTVERNMFSSLMLNNTLDSWQTILMAPETKNQFVNCIHGALQAYDLTDLINYLKPDVHVVNQVPATINLTP